MMLDGAMAAEEALLWAQAVLMSRVFKLPKGGSQLVLAPFVDIANHACTHGEANAVVELQENGDVVLRASRPVCSGDEVRICYGEYANEQLIFSYGFVLRDNHIGGPVCPLQPPSTPHRAALLTLGLQTLRSDGRRHGAPLECGRLTSGASRRHPCRDTPRR